jgi:hypothetical protein
MPETSNEWLRWVMPLIGPLLIALYTGFRIYWEIRTGIPYIEFRADEHSQNQFLGKVRIVNNSRADAIIQTIEVHRPGDAKLADAAEYHDRQFIMSTPHLQGSLDVWETIKPERTKEIWFFIHLPAKPTKSISILCRTSWPSSRFFRKRVVLQQKLA